MLPGFKNYDPGFHNDDINQKDNNLPYRGSSSSHGAVFMKLEGERGGLIEIQ